MNTKEEGKLKDAVRVIDNNMPIEIEARILFDKTTEQYSIKVPKRAANTAKIDPENDTFKFIIRTFPMDVGRKPELIGELVRG